MRDYILLPKEPSGAEVEAAYSAYLARFGFTHSHKDAIREALRAARAAAPVPAVSDTDRLNWIFSAAVDEQTAKNLMTGVFTVKQWRCAVDRHMTPPPVPKEGE
jgi:hypothetical protein